MGKSNLQPIIEAYNVEEEFMYNETYLFIKGYAVGRNLHYTLKALPLAREIHSGQYRKGIVVVGEKEYRLPYVLHVLKVASTLISLDLPLSNEELDILLASALLHDTIEDDEENFFKNGGIELVNEYGFARKIYDVVKLVSKHPGATETELNIYFNEIKRDKIASLVKIADRSHNVEDLYNMRIEKLHKYVEETRKWIYPLCAYGKAYYPELSNGITILKSKILSLTEATETIVHMYETVISEKDKEIKDLQQQIEELKNK